MATKQLTITETNQRHQGTFVSPGGRIHVQVNRDTEDAVWVEAVS